MTSALSVEIKIGGRNKQFGWEHWRNSWQNAFGGDISDPTKSGINWAFTWTGADRESVLRHAEEGGFDQEITPEGDSKLLSIMEDKEYIYEFIPTQSLLQKANSRSVGVDQLRIAARDVDVLLMTVTDIERKAVLSEMDPWPGQNDMIEGAISHNTYRLGQFGQYRAAHVESSMGSEGRDGARSTLQAAITELQPKAVLLIGIAFGLNRTKQHLGDVIIAESVFNYALERVGEPQSILRGGQPDCGSILSERFRHRRHDWELKCEKRLVKAHQGLFLSGPNLIANAEFRDQLVAKFPHREFLGGDMEGAGAYEAASRDHVEVILVKGICDWADGHKNDRAQPFAAYAAVSLAKYVLSQPDVLCELRARDVNLPNLSVPPPNGKIDSPYGDIIKSLQSGNLVLFLGHGINPNFYMDLATRLAALVNEGEEDPSIEEDSTITRIMGSPCSVCHYHIENRPDGCPLKGIKGGKDCPLYIEQELAVSKINLRYLSEYYGMKHGIGTLYCSLHTILEKINVEKIKPEDSRKLHDFLATLPRLMRDYGYPQGNRLPYPLIVTTNYDDMLEQSFSDKNQPFDLVFYDADMDGGGEFKYHSYEGDVQTIDEKNLPSFLHRTIYDNPPQPRPIILKLFGSQKIPEHNQDGFVASEKQLTLLLDSLSKKLPEFLLTIIKHNSILFMGYSPNDTDLSRIVNSLWECGKKVAYESWLLHQSQVGVLDKKSWDDRKVTLLQMPSSMDDFVAQLKREIEKIPVYEKK